LPKKTIIPQNALDQFKEMTQRASISLYYHASGVLVGKPPKEHVTVVVPDPALFTLILADKEIETKPFDLKDEDLSALRPCFWYGGRVREEDWFSLTKDDKFFTGKLIEITIRGHDFPVLISKELLPVKLKKAEFTDIEYRVFSGPAIMAIKKRFELLADHGFTFMRLFQII
jgi:hypothetical protein